MTYKLEIQQLNSFVEIEEDDILNTSNYTVVVNNGVSFLEADVQVNEQASTFTMEVYEIARGPEGPQGPAGASADIYAYTQVSASNTWLVNHNLGRLPVSVTVYTSGGQEVDAAVLNLNNNQTQIQFNSPFSGSARIL